MKRFLSACCCCLAVTSLAFGSDPATETGTSVVPVTTPASMPHCEVPCGVYNDQMRFEMMLEDTTTIAKAIEGIRAFADKAAKGPASATEFNQVTRWVHAKDDHATKTQQVVAQYFLTQRIKSDHKDYAKQLAAAHLVMVSAMKCKQDADPVTSTALKNAIYDLYRAYEGKEPVVHDEQEKK